MKLSWETKWVIKILLIIFAIIFIICAIYFGIAVYKWVDFLEAAQIN